jgi:hypothetical protein
MSPSGDHRHPDGGNRSSASAADDSGRALQSYIPILVETLVRNRIAIATR